MKKFLAKLLGIKPEVKTVGVPIAKVIEILESNQEKLSNRNIVLELCSEDADDYKRGKIQGQIDMLSVIMMELSNAEG